MATRRTLVALATVAVAAVAGGGVADAMTVRVPLDRSGAVPGTIEISLERQIARRPSWPPLLFLGGAQGEQSSFYFGPRAINRLSSGLRAGGPSERDTIVMDLRGTGDSGSFDCPELERAIALGDPGPAAAACAVALGPRRGFFTARDSAEDIEAVRVALGEEKLALVGAAYGAQVAFAYAQRYPHRVERLVLDSPVLPGSLDPLYRSSFAMAPEVVRSRCRQGSCRRASRSPVADFVALARRLERSPARGTVFDGNGRPHEVQLGPFDLYQALAGAGPFRGLGSDRLLPGLVRNALRGDVAPLLRIRSDIRSLRRLILDGLPGFDSFGEVAHVASLCEESPLPWSRNDSVGQRAEQASAFVHALPSEVLLPFGPRTALASDVLELCHSWPVASTPQPAPASLPPMPALLLVGEQALRPTPSDAEVVAGLIPGVKVLRFSGFGGGVITAAPRCPKAATGAFLAGANPEPCAAAGRPKPAPPPPPFSLDEVAPEAGTRGRAGRTLAAVQMTIANAAARPLFPFGGRRVQRVGGQRSGSYRFSIRTRRLDMRDVSYVSGVRITGSIARYWGARHGWRGTIRVTGRAAAHGRLTVDGRGLRGELGGVSVAARRKGLR